MFTLQCLPKELFWSIIEYAPESTSQTLHRRVNEYASFRSSDRSIDQPNEEVLIRGDYANVLGEIHIRILIRVRRAGLFELRLKRRKLAAYVSRTTGHMQWSYTSRIQYDCNARICFDLDPLRWKHWDNALAAALLFMSHLFRGITITKFTVCIDTISQGIASHILDIVKSSKIERLGLWQRNVLVSDPVSLLLELSSLVRALYIEQQLASGIQSDSRTFFFGVKNADWGPIIVDMFTRKLDKLCIWNRFFHYISNRSVDTLRELLPLLGKNVWMWSFCDPYPDELIYTLNEHTITLVDGELRIAHMSRQAENDCNEMSF